MWHNKLGDYSLEGACMAASEKSSEAEEEDIRDISPLTQLDDISVVEPPSIG